MQKHMVLEMIGGLNGRCSLDVDLGLLGMKKFEVDVIELRK